MRRPILLAIAAIIALAPAALRAQEVQVPADEAGRIQVITAELAERLGLFGEVLGFREARLFQAPDNSFVLELTSNRRGTLQRERRILSSEAAAAFRRDVTSRIAARAPSATLDQSGRTKLLVGSTVLGLGYYGIAAAISTNPDDERSAVAVYMLTAAASFFTPFLATRNRTVPDAVASMALWGAMRGPYHGVLFSQLGDATKDETKLAWSVVVGAAEGIAGAVTANALSMTSGRADLTGAGGDIGLGVGFGVSTLLGLDRRTRTVTIPPTPGFPGSSATYEAEDRTLQSAVMLGSAGLGLVGGYRLGAGEEWTRGDATVFRNVTGIGTLAGIAIGDIIHQPQLRTQTYPGGSYSYYEDRFSRIHAGAGLIGMAAGATLGRKIVAGRNFTTGQGTLLTLSPVAGALLGVGIAYLATPEKYYSYPPGPPVAVRDPNDHSELYLSMAALGAGAGFAALYPALAKHAPKASTEARLEFSINPLLAAHFMQRSSQPITLGSVTYRF